MAMIIFLVQKMTLVNHDEYRNHRLNFRRNSLKITLAKESWVFRFQLFKAPQWDRGSTTIKALSELMKSNLVLWS
jgi:hypothetical protein